MFLRIFSILVAIISPPFSALCWRGSRLSTQVNFLVWCFAIGVFFEVSALGGILIYSLVLLHSIFLVIFSENSSIFSGRQLSEKIPSLHLGAVFLSFVLMAVFFLKLIETEQDVILDSEIIGNGKQLFSLCSGCHRLTRRNFVGPHLVGIYERKAGSLADYKYSESMSLTDFYWTEENLIQFLQNPDKFIPGTRMAINPLSRDDVSDIVTYLKSI